MKPIKITVYDCGRNPINQWLFGKNTRTHSIDGCCKPNGVPSRATLGCQLDRRGEDGRVCEATTSLVSPPQEPDIFQIDTPGMIRPYDEMSKTYS